MTKGIPTTSIFIPAKFEKQITTFTVNVMPTVAVYQIYIGSNGDNTSLSITKDGTLNVNGIRYANNNSSFCSHSKTKTHSVPVHIKAYVKRVDNSHPDCIVTKTLNDSKTVSNTRPLMQSKAGSVQSSFLGQSVDVGSNKFNFSNFFNQSLLHTPVHKYEKTSDSKRNTLQIKQTPKNSKVLELERMSNTL